MPLIIRYPDGYGAGTVNNEWISFVDFAPSVLALSVLKSLIIWRDIRFLEIRKPSLGNIFMSFVIGWKESEQVEKVFRQQIISINTPCY